MIIILCTQITLACVQLEYHYLYIKIANFFQISIKIYTKKQVFKTIFMS